MFSRNFRSLLERKKNPEIKKKKYANVLEFMADNGIDPSITREELERVLKYSDGIWQQLCEDSGLDCIQSKDDSISLRKRKHSQLETHNIDDSENASVAKKSLLDGSGSTTFKTHTNESSMEGIDSTILTKSSSMIGSINISQDPDYMDLAATENTISTLTNNTVSMDTSEASDMTSQLPSINMLQNSTFVALRDQSVSTNFSESKDFTLGANVTDTGGELSKSVNTVVSSKINQSSETLKDFSLNIRQNGDFQDLRESLSQSESGSDYSKISTKRSLSTISETTIASNGRRVKLSENKKSTLFVIEEQSFLDGQDDDDNEENEVSTTTLRRSSRILSKSINNTTLEPSSQQTEMPSIHIQKDQDFLDLAEESDNHQKSIWRGRKLNGTHGSTTSTIEKKPNKKTKRAEKSTNIPIVEEEGEESSRNTEIPSIMLNKDQDFRDLAETPNISKKSRWRRREPSSTYESSAVESDGMLTRFKNSTFEKSSLNSTSFAIPRGPIVPRNNFNDDSSEASQSTPFLRRRSLRSISNNSMNNSALPKPIKAKRNLDVSSFLNDNPKVAFKEIQKKRKAKIIVNNDVNDKDMFRQDNFEVSKTKEHSKTTLSSQSVLSSHGDEEVEEENKERVLRRSARINKKPIVNVNDSVFQTATPAIRKTSRQVLNKTKKTNDTTISSRSCSPESVMSEGYSEFPILIDESVANLNGNSKKGVKHAIVRGKKKEQKVLVVRRPKVIKPNEDQIQFMNLRRSKRNRIPPVDESLLQKPIYEIDENGLPTLVGVSEVEVKDPLFVKYNTTDFDEINRIRTVQNRVKRQKKEAKNQNLAYYGIKHKK